MQLSSKILDTFSLPLRCLTCACLSFCSFDFIPWYHCAALAVVVVVLSEAVWCCEGALSSASPNLVSTTNWSFFSMRVSFTPQSLTNVFGWLGVDLRGAGCRHFCAGLCSAGSLAPSEQVCTLHACVDRDTSLRPSVSHESRFDYSDDPAVRKVRHQNRLKIVKLLVFALFLVRFVFSLVSPFSLQS
jgi:hypothetical protein